MPFPLTDPLRGAVSACFSERIAAGKAPGSYFAVFDETGLIFDGGFGRFDETGHVPDADTRFRIASCTKSFTCAALLRLRDAGMLVLDAPITDFVPELVPRLPEAHPIAPTVRMLMSMSGGLPTDDPWADRQEALTREAFGKVLRNGVWFASVPGSRFEYSNLGYALLGAVIEKASGRGYRDYVTDEILTPLGLRRTTFDIADVPKGTMATGYRRGEAGWIGLPQTGPGAFSCIGGIVTTGAELAKWAGWLCSAQDGNSPDAPLSSASRREMQRLHTPIFPSPQSAAQVMGYGFGLMIEDDGIGPTVSHSGGYPGFSAHMRWNPAERIGVIGLENATYAGVAAPVTEALGLLVAKARAASSGPVRVPEAVEGLAQGLIGLVQEWDDTKAERLCLENVVLDIPWPERCRTLAALLTEAGQPDFTAARVDPVSGAAFTLCIPCANGTLYCDALIGPTEPMRLQKIVPRFERQR